MRTFKNKAFSANVQWCHFKLYGVMRFDLEYRFAFNDVIISIGQFGMTSSVYRSNAKNGSKPVIRYNAHGATPTMTCIA